jgi:hypothetical protein
MHLTILRRGVAAAFAPRWTDECVVVVCGSSLLDLTAPPWGDNAALRLRVFCGVVRLVVPAGTRLSVHGFALGSRLLKSRDGEGPHLTLRVLSLFGGVEVIESPMDAAAQTAEERPAAEPRVLPETA